MVPQNNYNSNIKNHWSQINTTNKTMKESEILQELPKCDTEAQSEQLLVEKEPWQSCSMQGCQRPLIYKKNTESVRWNKVERNKRGMPVIVYVKESNFFISLMLDLDIMKPEIYLELNEI